MNLVIKDSFSTIIQAEARCHRIGQENEVKIYYLIAPKTADDIIWNMLNKKQKNLEKAGLVSNVENLIKNIKKSTFNVKSLTYKLDVPPEETKIAAAGASTSSGLNKADQVALPKEEIQIKKNYFDDEDDEDEEILKFLETLP